MSFNLGLDKFQEALVLALMLVFAFAVIYSNLELSRKIIVSVFVFGMIFLVGLFNQANKEGYA